MAWTGLATPNVNVRHPLFLLNVCKDLFLQVVRRVRRDGNLVVAALVRHL